MKVLITGTSGFVAPHLIRELQDHHHIVWGTSRTAPPKGLLSDEHFIPLDLNDVQAVHQTLETIQPEAIIHLAAQSNPFRSWEVPLETFDANVGMTIGLLNAAQSLPKPIRFLYVSSSDVYGRPLEEDLPLTERSTVMPDNPYAVSKISAEHCARLYSAKYGIQMVVVRPFSHSGPGQTDNFVVPAFARKIAMIEAGKLELLNHGDLRSFRDFTDVRDMVRAYRLILESDTTPKVVNVCSGKSIQIQNILDELLSLSTHPIKTMEDSQLKRTEKRTPIRGDYSLLHQLTGWEPRISLKETMTDVLEEQRHIFQCQSGTLENQTS